MFDSDVESKLNIYGGVAHCNNGGLVDNGFVESMYRKRLLEQFAGHLAHEAITKTQTKYSTEYRLEVYVLTPAQLEKYVQRRAERLHPSMPSVEWHG